MRLSFLHSAIIAYRTVIHGLWPLCESPVNKIMFIIRHMYLADPKLVFMYMWCA